MTTLVLTNGNILNIKEDSQEISREIWASKIEVRLTLILNPQEEVQARIMIAAIAYWY